MELVQPPQRSFGCRRHEIGEAVTDEQGDQLPQKSSDDSCRRYVPEKG
jgi:hypothetical protein